MWLHIFRRLAWVAVLLVASGATAQTTGRIEGRVTDNTGETLPGVTVTIAGPSLQGERTALTGPDGSFRLLAVPPGDYTLSASLDGFNPLEATDVRVSLDRATTVAVEMTRGFDEEVTVSGVRPVMDFASTTTGAEFPTEITSEIPVDRAFLSVSFLAPGVTQSEIEGSPSIRGASGAANRYIVDGLDVTDVGFGTLSSGMPFEFIDEVEVKTGGYEPEYGGALGGIINVITKSGGNEHRGGLFGYYTDDGLQASSEATQELGRFLGQTEYDFGVSLGGKLIEDKLWYFAALNPTTSEESLTNRQDIRYDLESERLLWAGKLSWRIDERQQLVGSLFGEERDGPLFLPTLNSAGVVANDNEDSAMSLAIAYSATLSSRHLLEVNAGHFEEPFDFRAVDESSPIYTDNSGTGFWAKQQNCGDPDLLNAAGIQFAAGCVGGPTVGGFDPSRDELRAALSWFAAEHELKFGFDYRRPNFDEAIRFSSPSNGPLVDEHGVMVDPDGVIGGAFTLQPGSYFLIEQDQDTKGRTEELALFVQDRWRPTPHLTFNLGVRFDSFEAEGGFPDRKLEFDFEDMIAPRVGFTWDVTRDGRSRLYGHFGRFFESVPLAANTRNLGQLQLNLYFFLYPSDGSLPTYDNLGTFLFPFSFGLDQAVDPEIEPMHTDEFVLGFEYEVRPDLAVGLAAVFRQLENVLEDISLDGGSTYYLTNPGGTYRTDPVTGEALPAPLFFAQPEREYRALELTLNKRFTHNWQLFSSYVYSENEGNYEGLGVSPHFTRQLDFPESLVGALGPLPNDRTHQLKAYGSYHWRFGLITGLVGEYTSGTPINKLGFFENQFFGRFVAPRGSGGETPDLWHLDLHFAYPIEVSEGIRLQLIADVFNVTNEQSATAVDQTWNFAPAPAVLDPNECGGQGTGAGTACPAGNPAWGTAQAFQMPRTLRLGVKLSWD